MKKVVIFTLMLFTMFFIVSCGPNYPKCDKDADCRGEKAKNKNEVCINQTCEECRDDKGCSDGLVCKENKCEPECTTDSECDSPKICKEQKCAFECEKKEDCDEGYDCKENKCELDVECTTDAQCDAPKVCIENACVVKEEKISKEVELCELSKVNFDFNEFILTSDARTTLEANAECIKSRPDQATVKVVGHCDERGTEEYNLNLGQKRANAVKKYLKSLGVSSSKIKTVSKGEEEPINSNSDEEAWSENRRSEIGFE